MKRNLLISLIAMLIISNTIVCLAATEIPDSQTADVTVTGRVEPDSGSTSGEISVVVPTKATFVIDESRNFISPDYTITNNSLVSSVKITAKSLSATPANTCKVVAFDKYTDEQWGKLTEADTKSNIALGLTTLSNTINWFNAEGTDTNIQLGVADANGGELTTKFSGKYGVNWGNTENLTLKYNMTLNIEIQS